MNHFLLPDPTLPRSVQKARAEMRGYEPARIAVASLDVGKDVDVPYISTLTGQVLVAALKVQTLKSGYQFFTQKLDELLTSGHFDLILMGHEPTGIYHESWMYNLLAHYSAVLADGATPLMRYRMVPPHLVKKERQRLRSHHRKNDFIDTVAINNLLGQGIGSNLGTLDKATTILRLALEDMRIFNKQKLKVEAQVLRMMDRLWPGAIGNVKRYKRIHPDLPSLKRLVSTKPLQRVRVRHLLSHCPNPHQLLKLGPDGIRELFHAHNLNCGVKTANSIYKTFDHLLLPTPDIAAIHTESLKRYWKLYLWYEKEVAYYEAIAAESLPFTIGNILTTYPGVSPILAARYLAPLGDARRFEKATEIWSFAGLEPASEQSGNLERLGKVSLIGSPYLRNTLYQIAHVASFYCPECIRLYFDLRKRGMNNTQATIHIANKVNRTFFVMLRNHEPYQSPLCESEQQKYLALAAKRRKGQMKF